MTEQRPHSREADGAARVLPSSDGRSVCSLRRKSEVRAEGSATYLLQRRDARILRVPAGRELDYRPHLLILPHPEVRPLVGGRGMDDR